MEGKITSMEGKINSMETKLNNVISFISDPNQENKIKEEKTFINKKRNKEKKKLINKTKGKDMNKDNEEDEDSD